MHSVCDPIGALGFRDRESRNGLATLIGTLTSAAIGSTEMSIIFMSPYVESYKWDLGTCLKHNNIYSLLVEWDMI